jgi:hypothetical protein
MSKQRLAFVDQQIGRYRGEDKVGYLDWEMFPQKLEGPTMDGTDVEDLDGVESFQRGIIKDYGPDRPTMEHEKPRRYFESKGKINLRSGARELTDPYANPEFNLSDLTKDPRGWTGEHDWREARRHNWNRLQYTDFVDDSNNSVPSDGINTYDMYRNIAATRDWVKSRWKVFDTSKAVKQYGGIGNFRTEGSIVPKVTHESKDGLVGRTFDEASTVNQSVLASNKFHVGSRYFRSNTTTDHEFKVGSYGKLFSRAGLIPHKSAVTEIRQDQIVTGDRRGRTQALKKMITANRAKDVKADSETQETFQGSNRRAAATKDILSMVGVTQSEMETLKQQASRNGGLGAQRVLMKVAELVEVLDGLDDNEILQVKNQMMRSCVIGGNYGRNRRQTRINQQFLDIIKGRSNRGRLTTNHKAVAVDVDGVLKKIPVRGVAQGHVTKTTAVAAGDVRSDAKWKDGRKVHTYSGIMPADQTANRNKQDSTRHIKETMGTINRLLADRGDDRTVSNSDTDLKFGESGAFNYNLNSWWDNLGNTHPDSTVHKTK